MYTIDSLLTLDFSAFFETLKHLILPAIALGFSTLAQIARLVRSEMIEVRRENYTEAAFALGLPSQLIAYKYILKNAFSSSLTVIGFQIGGMIAGSTLVELIYDINGIGRYAVFAIIDVDYNAIIGVILLLGTVYVISNAIVDVLYTYLDPRVRHGGDS
jgi:peptide/nickel transport system permease protein